MKRVFFVAALLLWAGLMDMPLMAAEKDGKGPVVFYASPDGNDAAKGNQKHPWGTFEGALANASEYMQAHPGTDVTVRFAGGEYQICDSVRIEGLNSALTVEAAGDGEPVICGDRSVTGWTVVTDASVLARMPASPAGKIWQADLRKCGIVNFGNAISRTNRPDLYYDGHRQTVSRWPDSGFAESGRAMGKTDLEDTWIHVHGTKEGVVEYKDKRIGNWVAEPEAYVFGYWYWDWADGYGKLASVDTEAQTFSLAKPWSRYGYRDGMRFYGLNLLCELDAPGEYYIDRKAGLIYWYAPEGFNPDDSRTSLSCFNDAFMLIVRDCGGFSIDGFTFRGGRRGAVCIKGGMDNAIRNCRFTCFGENVIRVADGLRHKILGCKLDELGACGIILQGGDRKKLKPCNYLVENTIVDNFSLFARTYEPAVWASGIGMTISHNLFQNSSSSALRLDGSDMTVQFCQCFDLVKESDDQGGSDSWFNYTFRRLTFKYNHWRDIRGGMFAGAAAIRFDDIISGEIVFGNVFERCGGGHFGAVQVNAGRDNHVANNVFYDCTAALSGSAAWGDSWREQMEMNSSRINEVDGLGPLYGLRYPELKASYGLEEGFNYLHDNIVVNADRLCDNPPRVKEFNNTEIHGDTKGLKHYLQPSVQKDAGLSPIPFGIIGVMSNRFAR